MTAAGTAAETGASASVDTDADTDADTDNGTGEAAKAGAGAAIGRGGAAIGARASRRPGADARVAAPTPIIPSRSDSAASGGDDAESTGAARALLVSP